MKRIAIILISTIMGACLLGSCQSQSNTGDSLSLPTTNLVSEVIIQNGDTLLSSRDSAYISNLLLALSKAEKTKAKSVQDVPVVDTYTTIEFLLTDSETSTIFMYYNHDDLLVEQPYQGIYSADKTLIDIVNEIG